MRKYENMDKKLFRHIKRRQFPPSNGRFIRHTLIACGQVDNASATRHLKVRGKIKLIFQALVIAILENI